MKSLTIYFEMDNSAFEDCEGWEAARILRKLAEKIEDWQTIEIGKEPIRDSNGNTIGLFQVVEEKSNV